MPDATELVYHCDPDGNWGLCRRGDLIVVPAAHLTAAEIDDIIYATDRKRFLIMADAHSRYEACTARADKDAP
ncbi:MAG: hypothetical protein EBS05_11535 [Proteobacteria bacterium]|nr:hypothetical protein [Pseudomonadota bacterium]NDA68935.1 hypothetical protein [Verrucomicrobiota bacterium]NDD40623.1 hypothetical protein [Verrucomicrobiota bacterium]NDF01014.1 hypothetical protein [Verrucomicrobiota bacterium]